MKIKEVIVVEGKNDTNKLKSVLECDTIETSGTHLSKQVLDTLKIIHEKSNIPRYLRSFHARTSFHCEANVDFYG